MQGSERAPRTAAELEALRAKRNVLGAQLEEVTDRRGRLGQERMNARARGDMAMVQEYDATIAELGTRMNRLEREQNAADDAIAAAVARGVGQTNQPETRVITLPGGQTIGIGSAGSLLPQRDLTALHTHYKRLMAFEAAGFILLGAIVARFAWQRALRRAPRSASGGELAGLRTSVEAIAIEVERISENQRYVTRLLTEGSATPLARQAAEPSSQGAGKDRR